MSSNLSPQSPMRPLSVGNVVSSALVLYRSHLKLYLGLALKALLWWFVPVYGWAKASMISAQISRLAFSELVNQPETSKNVESQLNSRMWSFLGARILVGLILFGVNIGISILSAFVVFIPALLITSVFRDSSASGLLSSLLQLVVQLASLAAQLWFQARFFITDLPLAIENNVDATTTISRSWELTKGSGVRIQLILLLAYLITMPLVIIAFIPAVVLLIPFFASSPSQDAIVSFVSLVIFLVIVLAVLAGIFIMPFWQSIKAVIYYDLRSRREGLGLQLGDGREY